MTFEMLLAIIFIGMPISLYCNYKFATQLTNAYLYRKLSGYGILVALSFVEYFYFDSLVMGIVFTSFIVWELLQVVLLLSIIFFIVFTGKINAKDSAVYTLFFTHFKMRNLCRSENSNIYFIKKNGVNIYFDASSEDFQPLSDIYLSRFPEVIKNEKPKITFKNFLVLHCEDIYISVSSDELQLIDVDMFNINRNHFDILRMLKI